MEYMTLKGIRHYVYEIDEFEREFMIKEGAVPELKYDWREGETGDWVVSDDNRIVQILSKKIYKRYGKDRIFIRTIVGTYVTVTHFMDTDFSIRRYPQGRYQLNKVYTHWTVRQKFRSNLTSNEKKFVARVLSGENPVNAYYQTYDCIVLAAAQRKCKHLLKQPRIIEAIVGKSPKEIAEELGLGVEKVLKNYEELYKDSKNEEFKLKVNEKLGEIVDVEGKKNRENILPGNAPAFQISRKNRSLLLKQKDEENEY